MTLALPFLMIIYIFLRYAIAAQLITNCTDLQNIKNNLAGNYTLMNNVDCSATVTWNAGAGFLPIGTAPFFPFTGIFNGAGYLIYNLTINRPSTTSGVGLFGYVSGASAQIMQTGLIGVTIHGSDGTGGLAGSNGGGAIIINSYVTGSISGSSVGGLAGYNSGTIINSSATVSVSGSSGSSNIGGLVGNNGGTIINSYATGRVSGSSSNYVGGLIGYATQSIINNSYATGNIYGLLGSNYVGGLIGFAQQSAINNSYATGSLSGSSYVGGLLGQSFATITNSYATGKVSGSSNYVGGLVGQNYATITNCYATGNVSGSSSSNYVGGLVGINYAPITNSYATGNVSGSSNVGGLAGLSGANYVSGLDQSIFISQSYATGSVTGASYVGGLVGINLCRITYCYATGNITGASYIGGLVGENLATINQCYATGSTLGSSSYVGGLIGYNYGPNTISNCYATGSVLGPLSVGGLMGENDGTITNCYTIGKVSGSSNVGGLVGSGTGSAYSSYWNIQITRQIGISGVGESTIALYHNATYLNWDFNCVWSIDEGNHTPLLTLNNCPPPPIIQVQISNCDELQLAMFLYTADITLTQDIDCTATATWNNGAGFYPGLLTVGSFNGSDYRIMNLMINRTSMSRIGLFGETSNDAQISNVILEGTIILGSALVGSLVGSNAGSITNSYATGNVSGLTLVGGIVGSNGGTISNCHAKINVSSTSYYLGGLVGYNGGTINNCYTIGNVTGSGYNIGGLVGWNDGTISNSYATTNSASSTYSGLGGLVGQNIGTINQCHATGSVFSTGGGMVGGLAGGHSGVIIQSYATGSVSGSTGVGGLVGYQYSGAITLSYATGNITGSNNVGGFVGGNGGGTITLSYATGTVLGISYVGGFVGSNGGTITNCYALGYITGYSYALSNAGGLAGTNSGTINQCYVTGNVSYSNVAAYVGGLVGANAGGTAISDYWNIQTSSQISSAAGAGLTTQAMKQPTSFVGWDFITTWVINPGVTYPLLQAFIISPVLSNSLNNVTQYIGSLFKFTIPENLFNDPNELSLTYSAELVGGYPLPAWLVFNPSTQTFAGLPLSGAQGILMIEVSVHNIPSLSVSDLWQLTIPDRPPIVNAPFTLQVALNGQPFQFIIPSLTFVDPDADPLQLSAVLQNTTSLPAWLSFNAVLGIFSGTATRRGNVWINVTANDGFGGQVSALLEIITPDTAPTTTAIFPNQVVIISLPFSFSLPNNIFFDLDVDPLSYSATLFGGGQLPAWLSFDAQTLMFQGTPNAVDFLMVTVMATDPYNKSASLNFGVSVSASSSNSPPLLAIQMLDQTATVEQPFTLVLPKNMFVDPNNDPLHYSTTLEGGSPLPSWLMFNTTSLVFSGTSPTTGSLSITVRADDGLGGFALDTFTLIISSNRNLPPLVQNPLSNQQVSVGEHFQFTIPSSTFIDLNNAPLNYAVTTSNNGPLPGWLHFDANTHTFAGTPKDTDTNIYSARITVIEVRASNSIGSAVTTFQLSVTGTSQAAKIINALITLASIASTAFAMYRNRAFLWNTLLKKKYEKETKIIALNEPFTYQFKVPSEGVIRIKALNKSSSEQTQKKYWKHFKYFRVNDYQELPYDHHLPNWLQFDRDTMTLSGTATEPDNFYICAEGFDGRYLEAFKLRCGIYHQKDQEMLQI